MVIILKERWNIYDLAFEYMGYLTKTLQITITLENSVIEAKKKKKDSVSLMIYNNTIENEEK